MVTSEFSEVRIRALAEKMKKTIHPQDPGLSNPSIAFDYYDCNPIAARQVRLLTEVYHQYLINHDSDFPDSCIRVRETKYGHLSFKFSTPEMGLNYMQNLGPIITDILAGKFQDMSDKEYTELFRDHLLGETPDFTSPEVVRPVAAGTATKPQELNRQ